MIGRLTFAEVLRGRLTLLLKEQEESQVHMGSNWLSQEAAASKAIRQAGTLRRSAWIYLLSVVSPMLAEVIAFFDRNSNLDLLKTKEESWLHQLWLHIAANNKAIDLHYTDCLSPKKRTVRETVPVQTSGYDGQLFQCQLPFSWLIKELVDKLWQDAKVMTARTSEPFQEVFRNAFDETEIGRQLSKATKSCDPAEVMVRYIHDYVLMTHKITTGSEVEVKLICRAVEHAVSMVRQRQEVPLAPHITDVHVAVDDGVRGCLSRFSQLMEFGTDQLPTLETALRNRPNMTLDVTALRLALEKLAQELWQLTTTMEKERWGSKLQSVVLLAEDLFAAYKVSSSEQIQHSLHGCRCFLARLRVVKLYLDHLCGADQPLPMERIKQLWNYLEDEPNFKTKPTMKKLELFLVTQSKKAAFKHFAAGTTECCVCRNELSQPVILPCRHVCDQDCLTDWLNTGRRTCPHCRQPVSEDFHLTVSFESKQALRKHKDFRRRSNAFFMDVVSMFCFADNTPPQQDVIDMLLGYIVREVDETRARTKGFSPFEEDGVDRTPIIRSFLLQLLLRYKIRDVCAHLEKYFEGARGFAETMEDAFEVCVIVVQCMENALTSKVDRQPERQVYLMELAASELEGAAKRCKEFPNIPLMLQLNMIASIRFGLSTACDVMYRQVNQKMGPANDHSRRSLRRLLESVQTLFREFKAVTRWPMLFIPKYLYRRHGLDTLMSIGQSPEWQWFLPDEMRGYQDDVVPDRFVVCGEAYCRIREAAAETILTHDINHLCKALQDPDIPQQDKEVLTLLAIFTEVTLARVSTEQNANVISQAHYLPTMPDDPLPELKKALANQEVGWYQCPKGHHYIIGDCTRPAVVGKCHCGAGIGGTGHTLLTGNRPGRDDDATSTGHIMGAARDRPVDPIPERQLSTFSTVIIRLVLHAAMLSGANRNLQPFTNFVRPLPTDIPDFLWRHLNHDLDDLARVLGRSIDDATLLVHILLTMVSQHGNKSGMTGVWNVAWTSVQGRKNWEDAFNNVYIKPLLQDLDNKLQEANRLVDGDRRLTPFHRVLLDSTTPSDQLSLENVIALPEIWQYRPSVSLEHMSRCFVEHQAKYPMLKMFLDNASILSAMCHLPDIIHLISLLRTRYHRNIDLTEALTMKIAEFLNGMPHGQQRQKCGKLVNLFSSTWTTTRPLLLQQDNIPRPENMDPSIDIQTTSLYHLLPMKEDATVTSCMTAVVLFLIRKNNEFLDIYRKHAGVQDDHCNYSLAIGKGTQVGYDFAALEKQLIDRFLCGKCKIEEQCETFQFRQEARDVAMFSAVRRQIPQETISPPVQLQIILESTSLENVCVSLAAVDIAIFFLASAGGDADKLLCEYLHRVLKMGKASRLHSDKARNHCRLKHALSLWQLLSVQRARLLLANGQDPFDNVAAAYTKQLEEDQVKALENTLKNMDVSTLVAEMYEFVVVSDDKDKRKPEWSLRDTLVSYLDEKDAPEVNGFLQNFPETILLEHVCDTWRILANYNQEDDSTN
ncbi:hypothetical protein Bbelb_381900 [Branchiostoma belcheri]|nr:hypothetical protein Bbelb_381900 [Branchiostoma belcheri]